MASVDQSVLVPCGAPQRFVELALTYEFATRALETVIGPVFNRIADSFIDAFVRRADVVYAT
jgi:ribosome-associated toxin RatA of RatAB toxin-antitoxin module